MLFSVFTTGAFAAGNEAETGSLQTAQFTDVHPGAWYYDGVQWVAEHGLMRGTSDRVFHPNGTMSRAMAATVLYRAMGEPAVQFQNIFTDVRAGQWYSNAIVWAENNGIVNGIGNQRFDPSGNMTREQFATILHRWATFKGVNTSVPGSFHLNNFHDQSQISSWALEAMRWAVYSGLMTGTGGNHLSPQGLVTRAQSATLLYRFLTGATVTPPVDPPGMTLEQAVQAGMWYHELHALFPDGDIQTAFEQEILRLVNLERANHGLQPVQWNNILHSASRNHSVDMATRGFYAHTCPDGITASQRARNAGFTGVVGENLARASAPHASMTAWMSSPGHRANILNEASTYLGIGVHIRHVGDHYEIWWTLKMGVFWDMTS